MTRRLSTRLGFIVISGALVLGALGSPSLAGAAVKEQNGLYLRKPDQGAKVQIGTLRDAGDTADATLVESMIETPQAVWFTQGTPAKPSIQARYIRKTITAKLTS